MAKRIVTEEAELTPGQKAARTRAANKRKAELAAKREARAAKKAEAAEEAALGVPVSTTLVNRNSKVTSAAERLAMLVNVRGALHEELLETRRIEAEMAQELAREVLDNEPEYNGEAPVVAFEKKFSSGANSYSYVAIGIGGEAGPLKWYVSTSHRGTAPMTWAELVSFMGVNGLATLQVLR